MLKGPGKYTIKIKLNAGMIPVNLIDAIKGVGFDYGMTPKQIARRVVFGFLTERNSMRYHSIDSQKQIDLITSHQPYRQKAALEYGTQLNVVNGTERQKILEEACITYYAGDVMRARVNYIKSLITKLKDGQSWLDSKEFKTIDNAITENPLDNIQDIKTFVQEKAILLKEKDELAICDTIISLIIPDDLSDLGKGFKNHNAYIKEPIAGIKTGEIISHLNNGLLVPKIAGHESLYTITKTIEIK